MHHDNQEATVCANSLVEILISDPGCLVTHRGDRSSKQTQGSSAREPRIYLRQNLDSHCEGDSRVWHVRPRLVDLSACLVPRSRAQAAEAFHSFPRKSWI